MFLNGRNWTDCRYSHKQDALGKYDRSWIQKLNDFFWNNI